MRELRRCNFEPEWERAETEEEFVSRLHPSINVILADYNLPKFDGLEALKKLQESKLNIPFIIVSGSLGDELVAQCIKQGVTDYLMKDRLDRLGLAVSNAIDEQRLRSERRVVEEQLRQAQKMEAVGELAAGIAHDFNNQLTTIVGYAELASHSLAPDHPAVADLEEIVRAAQSSAALTRQLLTFSRRQVLNLHPVDLADLLTSLEKMLRRSVREDISIATRAAEPHLWINADRAQIEHILLNLVVNARDAMPSGGRILIEISPVALEEAYVGAHLEVTPGDYVVMSVTDTGEGIPHDIQDRIFDPFFTTKAAGKGTGLGLAMVYGSVKQMGGTIWVYSEPGRGTTFKMYFPRLTEADAAQNLPAHRALTPGTGTILIVDDDDRIRSLTIRTLERAGYRVHGASNGAEALTLARRLKDPIDLLVTDIVMPDVNGPTLAQTLVDAGLKRVLYVSGYADQPVIEEQIARGAVSFLAKPFSPSELADKVARVLAG